jgi:hypothetical protein
MTVFGGIENVWLGLQRHDKTKKVTSAQDDGFVGRLNARDHMLWQCECKDVIPCRQSKVLFSTHRVTHRGGTGHLSKVEVP